MMDYSTPYRTIAGFGEAEHIVERSRFLAYAHPVDELDVAMELVADLRREHYNARHVCYGLRIGRGAQGLDRSNDDGEPARTGGYPLWQILEGEEVVNTILIVVRYFGGIKLGMGGLARAYRESGRLALHRAGMVTIHPEVNFSLELPYDRLGKIQHVIEEQESIRVVQTEYTAGVTLHLAVRSAALAEVRALLGAHLQCSPESIGPDIKSS